MCWNLIRACFLKIETKTILIYETLCSVHCIIHFYLVCLLSAGTFMTFVQLAHRQVLLDKHCLLMKLNVGETYFEFECLKVFMIFLVNFNHLPPLTID